VLLGEGREQGARSENSVGGTDGVLLSWESLEARVRKDKTGNDWRLVKTTVGGETRRGTEGECSISPVVAEEEGESASIATYQPRWVVGQKSGRRTSDLLQGRQTGKGKGAGFKKKDFFGGEWGWAASYLLPLGPCTEKFSFKEDEADRNKREGSKGRRGGGKWGLRWCGLSF